MSPAGRPTSDEVVAQARMLVRDQLDGRRPFTELDDDQRRELAAALVGVATEMGRLLEEEADATAELRSDGATGTIDRPARSAAATTLGAGDELGLQATRALAGTTQEVLRAVSFPRFVEELVNGVFDAMVSTSVRQMQAYVELLDSLTMSSDSFADRTVGQERARRWLAETYPDAVELGAGDDDVGIDLDGGDDPVTTSVARLRDGASMPEESRVRQDLGLGDDVDVPRDPERLVPLVRRTLARQQQESLATLVTMGLQRIVVEHGSIRAGMRFQIDARSAAAEDAASRFDLRNEVAAAGRFGIGAWGASAAVRNTIGYVRTNQTQTTEELDTSLDLDSAVEINFRSDYLPLAALVNPSQAATIQQRSRNPGYQPAQPPGEDHGSRVEARRAAERTRRAETRRSLGPAPSSGGGASGGASARASSPDGGATAGVGPGGVSADASAPADAGPADSTSSTGTSPPDAAGDSASSAGAEPGATPAADEG